MIFMGPMEVHISCCFLRQNIIKVVGLGMAILPAQDRLTLPTLLFLISLRKALRGWSISVSHSQFRETLAWSSTYKDGG